MSNDTGTPLCVALGVSAARTLVYVLADGTEVDTTIRVLEGAPGERFEIHSRPLHGEAAGKLQELRELMKLWRANAAHARHL